MSFAVGSRLANFGSLVVFHTVRQFIRKLGVTIQMDKEMERHQRRDLLFEISPFTTAVG
jgi:hypothetical protein